MAQPSTLAVQEIRGEEAILVSSNGQSWRVQLAHIHGIPRAGQEVKAVFFTPDADGLKASGVAHHMINEFLNPPRP